MEVIFNGGTGRLLGLCDRARRASKGVLGGGWGHYLACASGSVLVSVYMERSYKSINRFLTTDSA